MRVDVGPERRKFEFHEALLFKHSSYFQGAFGASGRFFLQQRWHLDGTYRVTLYLIPSKEQTGTRPPMRGTDSEDAVRSAGNFRNFDKPQNRLKMEHPGVLAASDLLRQPSMTFTSKLLSATSTKHIVRLNFRFLGT